MTSEKIWNGEDYENPPPPKKNPTPRPSFEFNWKGYFRKSTECVAIIGNAATALVWMGTSQQSGFGNNFFQWCCWNDSFLDHPVAIRMGACWRWALVLGWALIRKKKWYPTLPCWSITAQLHNFSNSKNLPVSYFVCKNTILRQRFGIFLVSVHSSTQSPCGVWSHEGSGRSPRFTEFSARVILKLCASFFINTPTSLT